jgi:hypothetical protein
MVVLATKRLNPKTLTLEGFPEDLDMVPGLLSGEA